MDELMISGKRHISSRRAAKEYHYHSDYIGQLIRSGKISGQKVGHAWYVPVASLDAYFRNEKTKNSPPAVKEPIINEKAEFSETAAREASKKIVQVKNNADLSSAPISEPAPAPARRLDERTFNDPSAIQSEPKMLRYLTDEADRLEREIGAKKISRKFEEEMEFTESEDVRFDHERQNARASADKTFLHVSAYRDRYDETRRQQEEEREEEIPIPLRITSRAPYRRQAPANYYHPTEKLIMQPVRQTHNARAILMIIMMLLLGAAALGAGYFGSMQASVVGSEISR